MTAMAMTLTRKPLGFFKPDPGNPRQPLALEELQELAASLMQRQHIPLLVKPDGTILDGYRRWSAAMLDGKPAELDCIITDEPLTAGEVKEIQLVTALHRADLKPYEQFVACRDWLELNPGTTAKDLATKINRDPSMLVRILSLGRCIPAVQEAAAEGKLGPSVWYEISKQPGEGEQQSMLAATLAGESRDQLERRGLKLRNGAASGVKVNRLTIPLGQGRSVTIAGCNLTLDDALALLQETMKSGRKALAENLDGKMWAQVMKKKAKA
jgi:ParB/RepB/Spo0J family partition protein